MAVTDEALDGQPAIFDGAWWLLAALGATIAWADLSLLLFFFFMIEKSGFVLEYIMHV